MGIFHADFSDHIGNNLPLLQQKLHRLLPPKVLLGLTIIGQLDVLMELALPLRLYFQTL
jgi:hypothetical protein